MTNVEAYNILGDMWYEATSKEKEAINIAQDAVQFVDLMPKDMVAVVRCKDCEEGELVAKMPSGCDHIFCHIHKEWVTPDYFCGSGERKDGEG